MAENTKDPIDKLAESRNVPREEIVKELRELDLGAVQPDGSRSGGFAQLYQKGIFEPEIFKGDLAAHEAFGRALSSDLELMRAFDHYKRLNSGGKGIQEIIEEAGDSLGAGNRRELEAAMPWNGEVQAEFKNRLLSPYRFIALSDGTYSAPWLKKQAQEKIGPAFQKSDEELEDQKKLEAQTAALEAQKSTDGLQNVFLDDRPQIAAMRQQTSNYKDNPFLQGYEGNTSQIDNLIDIAGGEVSKPTSDASSRRKYQNARSSKEFVEDAAKRKLRSLDSIAKNRADVVNKTLPDMFMWAEENAGSHPMADKGVDNWTDEEKINFTRNFNLKNTREAIAKEDARRAQEKYDSIFNPGAMDKVPVYGKNGLEGYRTRSLMEKDMGGESVKWDETREEREARLTKKLKEEDNILYGGDFTPEARDEYYRRTKEPSAEEYYGIQERARARAKTDPTLKVNIADAVMPADFNQPIIPKAQQGPQQPLNEGFSSGGVLDKYKGDTVPSMRDKVSSEVNSVLNDVPMPSIPKTVNYNPQAYKPDARTLLNRTPNSSTYSIDQPSTPGVELTRTSKEHPTENVFVNANDTSGVDLTRTSKEYPTTDATGAQFRRPTQGFGRSGKKQYNINSMDRFDFDNYDYRPDAPKHPGGGFGRSGKKQYNIPALNFFDLDKYFYNQ